MTEISMTKTKEFIENKIEFNSVLKIKKF